ncbi:MAG: hypothetical protein A2162_00435 [Deltaproteobacteria bacterium RBG_13_52_11b]|nr:MAG: hypothetical protein A2162_00435 [Deltaproteobacteria bacterium RBG_13_52_11b]
MSFLSENGFNVIPGRMVITSFFQADQKCPDARPKVESGGWSVDWMHSPPTTVYSLLSNKRGTLQMHVFQQPDDNEKEGGNYG